MRLERRKERLSRFGVNFRQERLDAARYFFMYGGRHGRCELARSILEEIPGWQDDPYVRGQHAILAAHQGDKPQLSEDLGVVMRTDPTHPSTLFNHADLTFQLLQAGRIEDKGRVEDALRHAIAAIETTSSGEH